MVFFNAKLVIVCQKKIVKLSFNTKPVYPNNISSVRIATACMIRPMSSNTGRKRVVRCTVVVGVMVHYVGP